MDELRGKTAFITGGASGIGFAMARAFVNEGMHVVITDVDEDALAAAQAQLAGSNSRVLALTLDVTNREQYAQVADTVAREMGPVHVLCNNAGVYRGGALDQVTYADWDWVMGVNVGGVVNGIQTMVEGMKSHGQGGHIVNTASMAGVTTSGGLGVYNASKFAVVGMSEALRLDMAPHNIGVSVLCPGMVRTRILDSERTRPQAFEVQGEAARAAAQHNELMQTAMHTGIDPLEVAELVVRGIRENQLYLFPHPELKDSAAQRAAEMLEAFGEADPERLKAQQTFMSELLDRSAKADPSDE